MYALQMLAAPFALKVALFNAQRAATVLHDARRRRGQEPRCIELPLRIIERESIRSLLEDGNNE